MTLKVGDRIPDVTLMRMGEGGPTPISTEAVFSGKRVVAFALPGAFTPVCSGRHLPGFLTHAAAIRAKGVDAIVCLAVNDAFVMDAWAKDQQVGDAILMIADGNGDFTRAVGMEEDRRDRGMGIRSLRYAMLVEDSVVKSVSVEQPGQCELSTAESVLETL